MNARVSVALLLLAGAMLVPLAGAATGTLALRAEITWSGGFPVPCPPGTPAAADCDPRAGGPDVVPGLGVVRQDYVYPVLSDPPAAECRAVSGFNIAPYSVRLIVESKGEIFLRVDGITDCLRGPDAGDTVVKNTQRFTVTGGSGIYVGASGDGTVTHDAGRSSGTGLAFGTDVWTGTLTVPGLAFDLTPPTISGAANKVVRAPPKRKNARVTFDVTAQDDVDGARPVTCTPKSGSRFKVGKTRVACTAADTSGNLATATFTVTVKRRR